MTTITLVASAVSGVVGLEAVELGLNDDVRGDQVADFPVKSSQDRTQPMHSRHQIN